VRENILKLKIEISDLAKNWSQAILEIEGLLSNSQNILKSFAVEDWTVLKADLSNWSNEMLQILGHTLSHGDESGNLIPDNYYYGQIFTLLNNSDACSLLNDMDFFFENQIISQNLLDRMKNKLDDLNKNEFLSELEYDYWVNKIDLSSKDASR